jgi:hypothetical protein
MTDTNKQTNALAGSDAPTCCAFEVGDRVRVAGGNIQKRKQGYIKELLAPKDDCGTEDDLWVVIIKEPDGCMSEDHFYSRNLRLGWLAEPSDEGYAGYGVAHHEHNAKLSHEEGEIKP